MIRDDCFELESKSFISAQSLTIERDFINPEAAGPDTMINRSLSVTTPTLDKYDPSTAVICKIRVSGEAVSAPLCTFVDANAFTTPYGFPCDNCSYTCVR